MRELQHLTSQTRMAPVETIVPRLQRNVRQTAAATYKQASLVVVGSEILVDSEVLNQLIDTTLLKDRDFITWRAEQPPQPASAAAERQAVIGSATSADKHV
jgi:chemosensory pili system protein ChpA (sensor histidine kinase/response regulator)